MTWEWGLAIVIGIPLAVFLAATFWPQRIPKGRSVHEIQQRIEGEDDVPGQ
ncbi:hypothetical protein [Nocardia sp. NPDC051570]|uniref:hypothetical protein n=1 Tax=Nocardia sp. NPDC051570 TaxID=3364324 RepID=UPI003799A2D4